MLCHWHSNSPVQAVASERLKKMKAMRVEYNKLFHAVQESQKDEAQPYQTKRWGVGGEAAWTSRRGGGGWYAVW